MVLTLSVLIFLPSFYLLLIFKLSMLIISVELAFIIRFNPFHMFKWQQDLLLALILYYFLRALEHYEVNFHLLTPLIEYFGWPRIRLWFFQFNEWISILKCFNFPESLRLIHGLYPQNDFMNWSQNQKFL